MQDLPDWYPFDDETKPAPMPLLRVQAFVNTRSLEDGIDLLDELDTGRAWLGDAGFASADASLTGAELDHAREVREAIRALIESERPDPTALDTLRALGTSPRAAIAVAPDGKLSLDCPEESDLADELFALLLIIHGAQQDGSWRRLRVCANDECAWVFYDRSRNQQGSWCDMAVCGNRLKNRRLRARRR